MMYPRVPSNKAVSGVIGRDATHVIGRRSHGVETYDRDALDSFHMQH